MWHHRERSIFLRAAVVINPAGSRSKPQEVAFDGVLDQPNYMKLTVNDGKLTVTSLKQDGKLIDTVTLTK